ncbi:MAG: agmatine deiminase family protein [Anaerolineales bacterium]|nr:agmatine deiminase family protein [Anaerolineales bacterium]
MHYSGKRNVWLLFCLICLLALFSAAGCSAGSSDPSPTDVPEISETPLRTVAEWEPALGALIGWPLNLPKTLVVEIAKDDILFVMVADEDSQADAEASFTEWGIDPDQVRFIIAPQGENVNWPRDWGPHTVVDEMGKFSFVDPRFISYPFSESDCDGRLYPDPWGDEEDYKNDDLATEILAAELGMDNTQIPLALTGGNFLVDGHDTVFSTCTMLKENAEIGIEGDEFFDPVEQYLGIENYVVLPNYESGGIQHLDCAFKLLDEETIMIMRVPEDSPEYTHIEKIVEEVSKLSNANGRPYEIVRIDSAPFRPDEVAAYTNSLILNKKVFVPLYGIPEDQGALKTWSEAMPGYDVIGFEDETRNPWEGWLSFDAIHCRARAIFDTEMLYMIHKRIDETVAPAESYPIEVTIRDYSGAGLIQEELLLSWRLSGENDWNVKELDSTYDPAIYTSSISGVSSGQTIEYFLSAADRSGRQESLPRTAPDGFYTFTIES